MDEFNKRWQPILESKMPEIEIAMKRALASTQELGYGFVVVKKDRMGGYRVTNKTWPEVIQDIRSIGGVASFEKA